MSEMYFILCDGKISGRRHTWFAERDCDRLGLQNTVADISSMQIEDVSKVYQANEEDHIFIDVTEDIAGEVIDGLADEPKGSLFDFLENALGCQIVAEVGRERGWWPAVTMRGASNG